MVVQSSNVENLSPQIIRQVAKEMQEIHTNAPEGIKVQINESDITDIQAVLEGPGLLQITFLCSFKYEFPFKFEDKSDSIADSEFIDFSLFCLAGTPYAGGFFRVKLVLGKDFPQTPPKAYFLTKIFHPNVAANGEICVNTLKKDWKPGEYSRQLFLLCELSIMVEQLY